MYKGSSIMRSVLVLLAAVLFAGVPFVGAAENTKGQSQLESPANRDVRRTETLKEEVRHQLVTLPYYGVFDWLQAEVKPDGTISLMGEVVRPTTKDDAETRIKRLEG